MFRSIILLLFLAALVGVAPVAAHAQTRTPDLAQVVVVQSDLPSDAASWTQTRAGRTETWDLTQSLAAPAAPGQAATYQTQFTRPLPDGTQETVTSGATQGNADLSSAYFQSFVHGALGQTPIALPPLGDQSVAWWETVGSTRTATAAAQLGTLIVELHVTGVTPDANVSDDQVSGWLSRMVDRARSAPDAQPVDWSQLVPNQPKPWTLLLDQSLAGDDWQQQTGLSLASDELGGQVRSVIATREFSRGVPYQRTLVSSVLVYTSLADAMSDGMTGAGKKIDAPTLGEASAAFKSLDTDGDDTPDVTYTVDVRRGNVVMRTIETGVAYSLDTPDEVSALAATADARAARLLSQ